MIRELLDKARRSEKPRDPRRASVQDLYSCDRATWFRRNGYVPPPHSEATLRKFDIGHAVEAQIARRLGDLGVWVERDLLVSLKPTHDEWTPAPLNANGVRRDDSIREMDHRRIVCKCIPDWDCKCIENADDDEMTGHPDLWLPEGDAPRFAHTLNPDGTVKKVLVEVKTTDVRTPKDECSPHYALQAAAYALALDADETRVHVTHVVPFDKPEKEYVVDHLALRPRVVQRLHEVMERTYPGAPMPAAEPPAEAAAWACKRCSYGQCERNRNKEATIVAAPELVS